MLRSMALVHLLGKGSRLTGKETGGVFPQIFPFVVLIAFRQRE